MTVCLLQSTQIEALKRTVREYERQLQQAKLAAEEEKKRTEADRLFAQRQVMVVMVVMMVTTMTTMTMIMIIRLITNTIISEISNTSMLYI
jgi:hypothetical protein